MALRQTLWVVYHPVSNMVGPSPIFPYNTGIAMFECETITASAEGAVARLTLNKPGRLNALDEEMLLAVEE